MMTNNYIMMPIPEHQFTAVCALLGGVSGLAAGAPAYEPNRGERPETVAEKAQPQPEPSMKPAQAENIEPVGDAGELDAAGHPWSAELHASTKGKTKDGLWRMKVGVSRPAPKPGFPKDSSAGTGTASGGTDQSAGASATTANVESPAGDDDDEFAAFRAAAAASDAAGSAAAASLPARTWTDADLGALCNQAALKLGNPSPIREIINTFVPTGAVAHSRNVPADKREEFAKAVEAKAGIEFSAG